MKREYAELFVAIVLIIISAFPLFDILSNIDSTINVSAFSLAIIVIMLIVVLFSSIIYFISYWTDKFNQLHFKGAVYTAPEIYQVRGLHNSSSLYKITHYSALGRVSAASKKGVKTRRKTAIWTCSSAVRATDCLYSGNANMWYERHPYKMEIVGSTPTTATMKKAISDYYKKKGFICVYINTNKEPRRVATLHKTNYNTSMSYAKYLYTSHYKCDVAKGDEVDHINGDKMDDRIENLQVISKRNNIHKSHTRKEFVELTCPVCGEKFLYEKRNLNTHPNPCCSRKCGGIKSNW